MAALLATAVIWGGIALARLPRQEDPVLTWRLANVITRLPGAPIERVELLITDVLEARVQEVDEVKHLYSVSRAGLSLIQIELRDEVTVAEPVWQKVRQKLAQAAAELPTGVIGPELDDEIMGTFTELVAVTGPAASYRELKDHARRLERQLRYLPDTASTSLFGAQPEVIQVELDPARLPARQLSFAGVARALTERNTRRPSGRIQIGAEELLVETSGEFHGEDELRELVVLATAEGRSARLGDVSRIERTSRQPAEPLARLNGERAVVVGVRAVGDVRVDRYGERVGRAVQEFRGTLPAGIQCTVFHDLAQYTRERADELSQNVMWSAVLVFLSMTVFLGWRGAGAVALSIPVTALVVLVVFSVLGMPLNQMSVMALIMAFGMVVDAGTVVTDEFHRRMQQNVEAGPAAEDIGRLLAPLAVSTLTTVAAFLPIYLLPGGTGQFVQAIPVGLTICLTASLLVAVTVVPWLCVELANRLGRHRYPPRLAEAAARRFERLIGHTLRRPGWTVAVIVLGMASLAALGLTLRRDFFAPVQRDQFVIDVHAPQGSALAHTDRVVAEIEGLLSQEEGVVSTASFIGRNAPLVFYNLESQETYATHFAQLVVRVRSWQETFSVASRVQTALDGRIAGAHCCVHILEHGAPFVAPFEVRISGPSVTTLSRLGREAAGILAGCPGVRNVRDNYGGQRMKLVAEVNEPVARRIGLDQGAVADELQARLDGWPAGYLQEGDERIEILVRFPASQRLDAADLAALQFKPSADAPAVPFSTVARLTPAWEPASVFRRDRQRTLSVLAYPEFATTAAEVSRRFVPALDELAGRLPAGYRLELGGENEQRREAEGNLLDRAVYALGAIFLLLLAEFRRFRLALLIFALVPLSMGGAMLGLWLTGWPLNFMAIMGLLMVAGIAVNDGVVLVDGYESQRGSGLPLREMVRTVTAERFNHVLVTAVTDVAGFLPVALAPSLLWPPLAIVMIGGLGLTTLITLVGVPSAYVLLQGHHPASTRAAG
jgi:multidrug efflux pump subunit AcrB